MVHQRSQSKERAIVSEAAGQLAEILSRVPFLSLGTVLTEADGGIDCDVLVNVLKGERQLRLAVEVRSHAQMRDARLAADRLLTLCSKKPDLYPVFCSQYLSPSVRDFFEQAGISFFDFAGNYRLLFDDVFIERDAPAAGPLEKKRLRSLFAPMAARVLRRLFNEPHRTWKVMELAEEAAVSPSTVSLLKDKLIGEEYVREEDKGFVLQQPSRLLQAWSSQYRYKQNKVLQFYARAPKPDYDVPDEFENKLVEYCQKNDVEYAFTLFSGARRIAPFVRGMVQGGMVQSQVYVATSADASRVADALQIKQVDSGGNFLILVPEDADTLYGKQKAHEAWIVSDIQLYLDLASHPTRGEENAEYLLEQRLQPKW